MTLWTRPMQGDILGNSGRWLSPGAHLAAWILSTHLARQQYGELELVTDQHGAKLLVDQLQLPFTSVKVCLDDLQVPESLWACAKLFANAIQTEPFIQIDYDVLLWKRFPSRIEHAAVCTQHLEDRQWFNFSYARPYEQVCLHCPELPSSWLEDLKRTRAQRCNAYCTGIVGGHDVDLLVEYSRQSLALVQSPANRQGWKTIQPSQDYNMTIEQYALAAVCRERDVPCEMLLSAFDSAIATKLGFTHLLAQAKRNPYICKALIVQAIRLCPDAVDRLVSLLER